MKPFFRTLHRIWVISGALATVVIIGYMLLSFRALGSARAALGSDPAVRVERTPTSITFTPTSPHPGALLFFTGALVEPAAYAPLMRRIAERGHVAVLVPLPTRSAPMQRHRLEAVARARSIMQFSPSLRWVIGGHSKGGVIAVEVARTHPEMLAGLLLVGTSHPRESNLSGLRIPVLKVSGSRDGLASPEEVKQYASNVPPHTRFVEIKGGNHAQFGYYGFQLGDRGATISREQQQAELLRAIVQLLEQISQPAD